MRLTSLRLTICAPAELQSQCLRQWLLDQLRVHGEPLRWAITAAEPSAGGAGLQLQVEAVLIP